MKKEKQTIFVVRAFTPRGEKVYRFTERHFKVAVPMLISFRIPYSVIYE